MDNMDNRKRKLPEEEEEDGDGKPTSKMAAVESDAAAAAAERSAAAQAMSSLRVVAQQPESSTVAAAVAASGTSFATKPTTTASATSTTAKTLAVTSSLNQSPRRASAGASAAATSSSPVQKRAAAKVTMAANTATINNKNTKNTTTTTTTVTNTNNKNNNDELLTTTASMPLLPPTSLQRTQSTPLELELSMQVIANVKADMEAKPPPYTKAPPAHLLKFAPTEPEEGYEVQHDDDDDDDNDDDDDEDYVPGNDDEDEDDEDFMEDEEVDHDKKGQHVVASPEDFFIEGDAVTSANAARQRSGQQQRSPSPVLPSLCVSFVVESIIILVWLIYFAKREGNNLFSSSLIFRRLGGNNHHPTSSTTTRNNLPSSSDDYCFITNIDNPPIGEYRPDCQQQLQQHQQGAGELFRPCPPGGQCWGGNLLACQPPYLELAAHNNNNNHSSECIPKPAVQKIYQRVVQMVEKWTWDYQCNEASRDKRGTGSGEEPFRSPPPYMMTTVRDDTTTTIASTATKTTTTTTNHKIPMFDMEHILEMDPFLLRPIPELMPPQQEQQIGFSLVELLHGLIEATNPLTQHQLETQILFQHNVNAAVTNNVAASDETIMEQGLEKQQQQPLDIKIILVAIQPSSSTKRRRAWRYRLLSLQHQCRLRAITTEIFSTYRSGMKGPWLVHLWATAMIVMTFWLAMLWYYMVRAQQQQKLLLLVEDVHEHVLELLQTSSPKEWRGSELQAHVLAHCGPAMTMQTNNNNNNVLFYNRVWPRVVFDLRGNKNVAKSAIVANADLVDVWAWKPQQQDAEEKAPEEARGRGGVDGRP